jgi:hypothetical protein
MGRDIDEQDQARAQAQIRPSQTERCKVHRNGSTGELVDDGGTESAMDLLQNVKRKPTVGSMVEVLRKPLERPFDTFEIMAPA